MKDSPIFIYIHIILFIKSPSNFPIYRRDSPNFYTYKSRGVLKIIPVSHDIYVQYLYQVMGLCYAFKLKIIRVLHSSY